MVLHACEIKRRIDEHPSYAFTQYILGRPLSGAERVPFVSAFKRIFSDPSRRLGWFAFERLCADVHGFEDLIRREDKGVGHWSRRVGSRHRMHGFHAAHDRVSALVGNDVHRGRVLVVPTVVAGAESGVPSFTENLPTESADEIFSAVIVVVIRVFPF